MGKVGVVLGIGVDLLKTSRFQQLLLKHEKQVNSDFAKRLSQRILHPKRELPSFEEAAEANDLRRCILILSGSWAAKEAVFKSLDVEDQSEFQFKDWYRFYNGRGKPYIQNDDYQLKNPDEEFLLSISHDVDLLVAYVTRQLLK